MASKPAPLASRQKSTVEWNQLDWASTGWLAGSLDGWLAGNKCILKLTRESEKANQRPSQRVRASCFLSEAFLAFFCNAAVASADNVAVEPPAKKFEACKEVNFSPATASRRKRSRVLARRCNESQWEHLLPLSSSSSTWLCCFDDARNRAVIRELFLNLSKPLSCSCKPLNTGSRSRV